MIDDIKDILSKYPEKRKTKKVDGRRKGTSFERTIVKQLNKWADGLWEFRRSKDQGAEKVTGDIVPLSPKTMFPLHIEARKNESWSYENLISCGDTSLLVKWYLEKDLARTNKFPLVYIFSRNRVQSVCMLSLSSFSALSADIGLSYTGLELTLLTKDCKTYKFLPLDEFLAWANPHKLNESAHPHYGR